MRLHQSVNVLAVRVTLMATSPSLVNGLSVSRQPTPSSRILRFANLANRAWLVSRLSIRPPLLPLVPLAARQDRRDQHTKEWDESGPFLRIVCWRDLAEELGLSLTKRSRVLIFGRVEQRS